MTRCGLAVWWPSAQRRALIGRTEASLVGPALGDEALERNGDRTIGGPRCVVNVVDRRVSASLAWNERPQH